jgi:glycosyltransferase involved in cell wall biosynthesis
VPRDPYYRAEGVVTATVPSPAARSFPDADVVIATGWQTAAWVHALPPAKGAKGYFIQGHEVHLDPRAAATWALPLGIFTCARWLADAVRAAGFPALGHLPNAVDPDEFGLDRPLAGREPRILWLYHRHALKGPSEGLAALERIRAARPDVQADVFCARPPSHAIPDWVRVHVRPDHATLRRLYNESAVFLHPSHVEGWPLPPMEAMACGAAVVAAANDGVREYLDATCGRLVPVGDADALADAALSLLADDGARVRLAEAARERVATFSWTSSTDTLEGFLTRIADGEGQR